MKNSTLYIIGALVLLAIVAVFVFRKKGNNTTAADAGNGNMLTGGNYRLGMLLNTYPVGYSGASKGIGETDYNFIMRRQKEGWPF